MQGWPCRLSFLGVQIGRPRVSATRSARMSWAGHRPREAMSDHRPQGGWMRAKPKGGRSLQGNSRLVSLVCNCHMDFLSHLASCLRPRMHVPQPHRKSSRSSSVQGLSILSMNCSGQFAWGTSASETECHTWHAVLHRLAQTTIMDRVKAPAEVGDILKELPRTMDSCALIGSRGGQLTTSFFQPGWSRTLREKLARSFVEELPVR
jgi:hypothetical protein